MKPIVVLWEDSQSPTRDLAPHALLVRCVADRLREHAAGVPDPRGAEHRVDALVASSPLKGNRNVLKMLQSSEYPRRREHVVAVLDWDKAPRLANLPGRPCKKEVVRGLGRARADAEVVFLVENLETLLATALAAKGEPPATRKPTPQRRDELLARCIGDIAVRNTVMREVKSFARLVDRVCVLVTAVEARPSST